MTDYWQARRDAIRAQYLTMVRFTDDEHRWWTSAIFAARRWQDEHTDLGARMNLSLVPSGAKFEIRRSLPFDSRQLRNRRRDDTGRVRVDTR